MDTFGALLRWRREAKGMTQAQLAKDAGVTPQAISTYETGRSEPEAPVRKKLAEALQCDEADLFPRAKDRHGNAHTSLRESVQKSLLEWIDLWAKSPPSELRRVKAFLEAGDEGGRDAEVESGRGAAAGGLQNAPASGTETHPPLHQQDRRGGGKRGRR